MDTVAVTNFTDHNPTIFDWPDPKIPVPYTELLINAMPCYRTRRAAGTPLFPDSAVALQAASACMLAVCPATAPDVLQACLSSRILGCTQQAAPAPMLAICCLHPCLLSQLLEYLAICCLSLFSAESAFRVRGPVGTASLPIKEDQAVTGSWHRQFPCHNTVLQTQSMSLRCYGVLELLTYRVHAVRVQSRTCLHSRLWRRCTMCWAEQDAMALASQGPDASAPSPRSAC